MEDRELLYIFNMRPYAADPQFYYTQTQYDSNLLHNNNCLGSASIYLATPSIFFPARYEVEAINISAISFVV